MYNLSTCSGKTREGPKMSCLANLYILQEKEVTSCKLPSVQKACPNTLEDLHVPGIQESLRLLISLTTKVTDKDFSNYTEKYRL